MSQTRVLVVDDTPAVLEVAARAIATALPECVVDRADSLKAALALLRSNTYALVVSDLHLGDGTGTDLYQNINARPRSRRPAFVMVTGDTGHGRLPPVPVVYKPFETSALVSACTTALREAGAQLLEQ